jgi:hypothetical protein
MYSISILLSSFVASLNFGFGEDSLIPTVETKDACFTSGKSMGGLSPKK